MELELELELNNEGDSDWKLTFMLDPEAAL
jgi:hypothetical protein